MKKEISYWLDIPYTPRESLTHDIETDVVIIGGGITGVSAAYHCVKAGFKTVLIEKDFIASGSAGKNGGMVVEGFAIDFSDAVLQFGKEIASNAWKRTADTRDYVASLIEENNIDCDFSRLGSLYVASDDRDVELLHNEMKARRESSLGCEIISEFNPSKKAIFVSKDCSLHPVKFVRGLAEIAENGGLKIYEQTKALSFDGHMVKTMNGTITANKVIVAMESYKDNLDSNQEFMTTNIALVTEPLSDEDMMHLDWNKGGMFWNTGSDYIAVCKIGNRILLNGSVPMNPTKEDINKAEEKVINRFCSFMTNLDKEKIKVSHVWTGLLLYPKRNLPFIKSENGYYEIFGNGGNGLTNGIMLGRLITDHLKGGEILKIYQK